MENGGHLVLGPNVTNNTTEVYDPMCRYTFAHICIHITTRAPKKHVMITWISLFIQYSIEKKYPQINLPVHHRAGTGPMLSTLGLHRPGSGTLRHVYTDAC